MRYACPGSTILEPSPAPVRAAKRVNFATIDKDKGKGKLKPAQRAVKKEQIVEARKKEQLRQKAGRFIINYVFVGNLEPTITREELSEHFKPCGRITKVEIRCSRGQAVNVGIPNSVVSPRDRKYATVEFRDPLSVRKALTYHGTVIGKQQTRIIVCASAADLPEVAEIVGYQIKKMESPKKEFPKPKPRNLWPKQSLGPKATERFIDYTKPENDRIRFWGLSFAKTII